MELNMAAVQIPPAESRLAAAAAGDPDAELASAAPHVTMPGPSAVV